MTSFTFALENWNLKNKIQKTKIRGNKYSKRKKQQRRKSQTEYKSKNQQGKCRMIGRVTQSHIKALSLGIFVLETVFKKRDQRMQQPSSSPLTCQTRMWMINLHIVVRFLSVRWFRPEMKTIEYRNSMEKIIDGLIFQYWQYWAR